jgi:pre-mRNA-splicing factor SPF27
MLTAAILDIDPEITNTEREKAKALISRHLPNNYTTAPHPSLAPLPAATFSDLFRQEIDRVAAGEPRRQGIDVSRYEAPDEPASESDEATMREVLRNAYVSTTFLADRYANLELLDEFGKNAWLIGNSQTEEILQRLEGELAGLRSETENVNKARKEVQEQSKAELLTLQENWKRGIGKILEIQVATDRLRRQILEHPGEPAA